MSIKANTFTSYDAKGIREDLSNVIYNISPEETPFMNNIGRGTAKNTYYEWQTDALAAATTANAYMSGDDIDSVGLSAVVPTVRVGNYVQISRKTVIVSGTEEAVDKAGRKKEMAYQLAKMSAELKRDMESICLANQGAVAGNTSTARKTGALAAWVKTNTNIAVSGTPGVDPVYTTTPTDVRTDGTQRAFTEAILKDVMQQVWTEGGDVSMLMVGPVNKQRVSGFAGIAEVRYDVKGNKPTTIIGAADIYVSDFGNISVVPNRFQRERDAWFIDPEQASLVFLRQFHTIELAKTGDAEKRAILVEWGLKVNTEKAHGLAADLTTT